MVVAEYMRYGFHFSWSAVLIALFVVFVIVATAAKHRHYSQQTDLRLCRGCGTNHPPYAKFCRKCGRAL